MKNKILYCDTPLDPPGGGQFSLLIILRNINQDKFEPLVFIPREGEFAKWLKQESIAFHIVSIGQLYLQIRRERPAIIHCNSATTKYTFLAALIAKIFKIPFVWHVRVVKSGGWRDRVIARLSTKIIVISDAVKRKFSWVKDNNKVIKIFNAVDKKVFESGLDVNYLRREFNIAEDCKIVGVFSRLAPWKGHMLFLDAAKKLKEKIGNIKFLIVGEGDGEYKKQLVACVEEKGIRRDVIFAGFRKDVPRLMNLCDVIVNPSIEPEPFGRTIIEAMSCGAPVVATNMGGPKEIINDGEDGFLVSLLDETMAEKIWSLLIDSDLYDRISGKALDKIGNIFSVEHQMAQLHKIYEELISGGCK